MTCSADKNSICDSVRARNTVKKAEKMRLTAGEANSSSCSCSGSASNVSDQNSASSQVEETEESPRSPSSKKKMKKPDKRFSLLQQFITANKGPFHASGDAAPSKKKVDDRIPRLLNIISQIDESLQTSKISDREKPKIQTVRGGRINLAPLKSCTVDKKWMLNTNRVPKIKFIKQDF